MSSANVVAQALTADPRLIFSGTDPESGRGSFVSRAYVKHLLLPTLREGDIVILDNLGSHKSKAVRQMTQAAGARLWCLPRYSPDLNPIE
ncbi:hypothetical protein ACVIGA_005859 [Bradyrhizobium sp. USDA 3240]